MILLQLLLQPQSYIAILLLICVISGFRLIGDDNCALLGCYAASSGNYLPTFRDNLPVQSSKAKSPKRTSVSPIRGSYTEKFG